MEFKMKIHGFCFFFLSINWFWRLEVWLRRLPTIVLLIGMNHFLICLQCGTPLTSNHTHNSRSIRIPISSFVVYSEKSLFNEKWRGFTPICPPTPTVHQNLLSTQNTFPSFRIPNVNHKIILRLLLSYMILTNRNSMASTFNLKVYFPHFYFTSNRSEMKCEHEKNYT